ncbi:hypothetical protein HTG_04905 [Natrinema mahii]|nr:hypothetical protein HTG_04905 [Natrinema mahii]
MPPLDIRSYTARAEALVDASPPTTLRDTRRWLVEPLLETLGWDVRADSCLTDRDVDDVRLEYVPTVDSVPALFVAVEPTTDLLDEHRVNALRRAMARTGVDRAIYTNGCDALLLAGTTDIDYCGVRLPDLPDEESTLASYTRATLGSRLERHSRDLVARQLAVERPTLVASIVDRLTAATAQGEAYAPEFEAAAERFLDQLVVAFAEGQPAPDDGPNVSVRFSESTITDDGPTRERTADSPTAAGDAALEADDSTGADHDGSVDESRDGGSDTETDGRSEKRDDKRGENGEYVVRFFNERGSIGAIGHSTSDGALIEAADYLLDRGLAGIDPPWRPDGSDRTVLNDAPVGADGSPMAAPKQLSNGLALETAGSVDQRAARVKALADRAGLRAMLTGDWAEDR